MDSDDIENRIKELTQLIWGYTIEDYCKKKDRYISGFIYTVDNEFENTFFTASQDAIVFLNENRMNMDGIVAFYSTVEMSQNEHNFDLLIINESLLKSASKSTIDAILIHELCHKLIESGYVSELDLTISMIDASVGISLNDYFQLFDFDIYHNVEFGELLSYSITQFNPTQNQYLLTKSIWFNLKYHFDESYKLLREFIESAYNNPN